MTRKNEIQKGLPDTLSPGSSENLGRDRENPYSFEEIWKGSRDRIARARSMGRVRPGIRTFHFPLAVAASVLLFFSVSATLFFFYQQGHDSASYQITMLGGWNSVKTACRNEWKPAVLGEQLVPGSKLSTGETGVCEIALGRRVLVQLAENTRAAFRLTAQKSGERTSLLQLSGGSVTVFAPFSGSSPVFEMTAGPVRISGDDALFVATITPGNDVQIAVGKGSVRVSPRLELPEPGVNADLFQTALDRTIGTLVLKSGDNIVIFSDVLNQMGSEIARSIKDSTTNDNEMARVVHLAYARHPFNRITSRIPLSAAVKMDSLPLVALSNETGPGAIVRVSLESEPSGATVKMNGLPSGITPYSRLVVKNGLTEFTVELRGYRPLSTNMILEKDSVVLFRFSGESGQDRDELKGNAAEPAKARFADRIYHSDKNYLKIYRKDGTLVRALVISGLSVKLTRPVINNGRIYLGSDTGGLYIYTTAGDYLFSVPEAGILKTGFYPVAAGNRVILPTENKGIEIYTADGVFASRISPDSGDRIATVPYYIAGEEDVLLYLTISGKLTAYRIGQKQRLWSVNTGISGRDVRLAVEKDRIILYGNAGREQPLAKYSVANGKTVR